MYVGHFAIGLAIKARMPEVPTLPIMLGVGFLDILDGLFIIAGFDRVTPNLLAGPYLFFDLTFIDWDHSLLMALLWSLVWGVLFSRTPKVALVAALAAFSHFIADWPMHNGDLALYPHSSEHLGYAFLGCRRPIRGGSVQLCMGAVGKPWRQLALAVCGPGGIDAQSVAVAVSHEGHCHFGRAGSARGARSARGSWIPGPRLAHCVAHERSGAARRPI
jgi:hypothetical protein